MIGIGHLGVKILLSYPLGMTRVMVESNCRNSIACGKDRLNVAGSSTWLLGLGLEYSPVDDRCSDVRFVKRVAGGWTRSCCSRWPRAWSKKI
jgi:hypothetical protein